MLSFLVEYKIELNSCSFLCKAASSSKLSVAIAAALLFQAAAFTNFATVRTYNSKIKHVKMHTFLLVLLMS